jgi:hypothetical protein
LFSRLLSKNAKIKTEKIIIFPLVLYGAKLGFLTLREGHRLKVYENRVLGISELKKNEMSLEKIP